MDFRLCKLHNSEKGKRCFILSNGPSINDYNLNFLDREVVISLNAAPLLENKYKFKAKYYCLSDPRFLEKKEKREIFLSKMNDNSIIFCRDNFHETLVNQNIEEPKTIIYLKSLGRDGFSKNLHRGFYFGCSTTHLALQLSYWLGCKDVYILGLDLTYPLNDTSYRFYKEEKIQEFDYLVSIQLHNYIEARKTFENDGKNIFICNKKSWALPYIKYKFIEELNYDHQ